MIANPLRQWFCVLLFSLLSNAGWAAELTAKEIMERNFVVSRVRDSSAQATLTLLTKNGQERQRKIFAVTKLAANGIDNQRMTRFLSPPDIRGTVSLIVEQSDKADDIWVYLPALKKVRRLSPLGKKDSFMGTDFSFGDVIGHRVGEWNHRLLPDEPIDGTGCYVVESLPTGESVRTASGYSKRVSWIRKDNYVLVKGVIWDETGQLLKTIRLGALELVDSRTNKWQAMRLEATNEQSGHRSVIQMDSFKANQQIGDEFFNTRYMEKEE